MEKQMELKKRTGGFYGNTVRRKIKQILAIVLAILLVNPITSDGIVVYAQKQEIAISGIVVDSSDWYAATDNNGLVSTDQANADNWNIHVVIVDTTATVTLKNATIANNTATAIMVEGYDLNIVLEGTANKIGTNKLNYDAIQSSDGRRISITGDGDLTVNGYYGIRVNGSGDVSISIKGSFLLNSSWQIITTSGYLSISAANINTVGYYISCRSASVTATDSDIYVDGKGDYGLLVFGNATVTAPKGKISITGGHYALHSDGYTVDVSSKKSVSLKGTVMAATTSVVSETEDITINGYYKAIESATNSVSLLAPFGNISLTSDNYSNIISGSGYDLAITAKGTLYGKGPYGITDYVNAVIKADSVDVSLTDKGYGFCGGALSITDADGGNCSEVTVSGGGNGRDTILATDLTIKADQVKLVADTDAANVINASGNVVLGDKGLIVGKINISGTSNIDTDIVQVNQNGGDVSSMLDMSQNPPAQSVYYTAGEGYGIFMPAVDNTMPTLLLHHVDITQLNLPNTAMMLQLDGENKIYTILATKDMTVSGRGTLDSNYIQNERPTVFTINNGATVNALYRTIETDLITTIYGNYKLTNSNVQSLTFFNTLELAPGAVLTLEQEGFLEYYNNTPINKMTLGTGASIINNTYITLPQGTTVEQIKQLPLTGSGVVRVATAYDGQDKPTDWMIYTNDGVEMKMMQGDLDLTDGTHDDKTVETDGYSFHNNILTLSNTYIQGDVTLPSGTSVNTVTKTAIYGRIRGDISSPINITFTGTAPLSLYGGISGSMNNDTITVSNGAKVTVNGSLFLGGSGGQDGTLTVSGSGTVLTVSSSMSYGVMCDILNVQNGAILDVTANGTGSIGVEALSAVNVTGGSTLTAGCDYGVYIIGGKLTVSDTSKLITKGGTAPFCIIDATSAKGQNEVLSLEGVPTGTSIASAKGIDYGYGYTYWSLVSANDVLTVANENSTPVTLIGAKKGTITFVKVNSGGSSSGGSFAGGSTSSDSSTTIAEPEKQTDQPVMGSVNAKGKVTESQGVIRITDKMVKAAIQDAKASAKAQNKETNGIGVEVLAKAPGAKSYTIITERAALNRLISNKVQLFRINGLSIQFCFKQAALKQLKKKGTSNVTILAKPATIKSIRSAYDITINMKKNGKTVTITSFERDNVTMTISYTPSKEETAGGLYAVYVNAKGKTIRIKNSTYDKNSKGVIFKINYLSKCGIGYKEPKTIVTDTQTHWAKESIDYLVGRGVLTKTSKTACSSNSYMTRGMLASVLGKLAGVNTKAFTTTSFTDVNVDHPYFPYVEWAYKNGVIQDVGNSQFAPDKVITREEAASILVNYAKATSYKLPVTREAITYADESSISSTCKEAVKAMQQAGIIMCGSDNKFSPKVNVTIGEISAILHRYIKLTIDPATAQG
ncbi:S-layer homology domain-containing protein [Anaeromicropila populeti]|uniref:S-layer homology domain-containing protein n=1 Tax=Anaeromicropila populeti TaxID=37658 RepID=A0A1I6K8D2_9FIRM|nr:S-layer homology domain-containing protein [Anaeromicropila populeti]SFR87288.1 S-layer homology domain-containing protein [Anaeromicropila populeti]